MRLRGLLGPGSLLVVPSLLFALNCNIPDRSLDPPAGTPEGAPDATFEDSSADGRSSTGDAGTDATRDLGSDGGPEDGSEGPDGDRADGDSGSDAGQDGSADAEAMCWDPTVDASSATAIAAANESGFQDIPAGVTPNASTILVQRGACSSALSLFIVDRLPGSGDYESQAVTNPTGMNTSFEENVTLTPDGLSMIAVTSAYDGFLVSTRSELGATDFGPPVAGDYAQITTTGAQNVWAPSLSADGLAFYYVVKGDPSANVNGIYESLRTATNVPFPPGTRMPALVQSLAQYVDGLSSDRLTIFLEASTTYQTTALTRSSVNEPFVNPLAPNPPPTVPGLRTRPLTGCAQFIGSCQLTGTGCAAEEVCIWGR